MLGTNQPLLFPLMPGSELAAASMKTGGCESSEEGRYPVHLSGRVLSLQSTLALGTEFLLAWSNHVSSFLHLRRTSIQADTHRWSRQAREAVDPWSSELCRVFSRRSKPIPGWGYELLEAWCWACSWCHGNRTINSPATPISPVVKWINDTGLL